MGQGAKPLLASAPPLGEGYGVGFKN